MAEPSSSIPNVSFDNIINFRDVGRTINQFAGKKYSSQSHWYRGYANDIRLLKEGVLFRSARVSTTID
jgi:hypothetical protein